MPTRSPSVPVDITEQADLGSVMDRFTADDSVAMLRTEAGSPEDDALKFLASWAGLPVQLHDPR